MDHTVLFDQTLTQLGFELVPVYNCFDVGYDPVQGWPLKLPDIDFTDRTLLLLHFQDFVTPTATGCVELDRVEQKYGSHANQVFKIKYNEQGLEKAIEKDDSFNPPENDNFKRVSRSIEVLYSGAKILGFEKMLEWKLAENMTRPFADTTKLTI